MSDPFSAIAGLGERLNRLSRRMTPGALGGRTDLASPKVAVAGMVPQVTTPGEDEGGGGGLPFCWAALDSVPAGGVLSDVPDSTWTPIAIDSGDSEQVGSNFSLDDLTGEVTVLADVAVEVAVYSTFDADPTGTRALRLVVNGSGWPLRAVEKVRNNLGAGIEVRLDSFGAGRLFTGDVVTVEMWQNSGAPIGLVAGMLMLTVVG